ncbi:MAG: tetraacyldisaccharide 4'-kinase [Planctomycetia bacterium]|nr:tetraacyldisaccharide 4'-kinase [Planctomycetia bacterium]
MLSPERFGRIMKGTERGFSAWLWRRLFRLVLPWYVAVVARRNRQFDEQESRGEIFHAGVPTLSVGNLTLGGTGKTPMVLYLAEFFLRHGRKTAILSRGYRRGKGMRWNDEGLEIARRLPDVRQFQHPDRVKSACEAVAGGAEILLLDDGFQHRKLARDGNLLLVDASAPLGINGQIFPMGTLREAVSGIRRADGVILTHAEQLSEVRRDALREEWRLRYRLPETFLWAETVHRPVVWETLEGKTLPLDTFSGRDVGIFSAIATPEHFHQTVASLGISCTWTKIFPDHHRYTRSEMADLFRWGKSHRLEALLCTGKDLGKIVVGEEDSLPIFSLRMELSFLRGEKEFQSWLERFLS